MELPQLTIVLFGRITVGKSTLGDIILGDTKRFTSKDSPEDRTEKCHVEKVNINYQNVTVVDTPGLFKLGKSEEELVKEIKQSINLCKPGPHVFLIVERLKVITSEELKTLEVFKRTFGERAMAYAMVVFTYDNTEEDERDVKTGMNKNPHLRELIERCQWRYFTFNIEDRSPAQVTELLKKITEMRKEYYYTPEMLQEAEKAAKEDREEEKPKTELTTDRRAFLERRGLVGIIVGSVAGYLFGGGELTSTSGALLGALAGSALSIGTTALGMKAKVFTEKCCKK